MRRLIGRPRLPPPDWWTSEAGRSLPLHVDWASRPVLLDVPRRDGPLASGTRLAPAVTLHHDGDGAAIALRATAEGLEIATEGFDGRYLSLALALPGSVAAGLRAHHVLGLAAHLGCARPAPAFARITLPRGGRTAQATLPLAEGAAEAAFDLFYHDPGPRGAPGAWLDLIFERPGANRLLVGGLTLRRHPRLGF